MLRLNSYSRASGFTLIEVMVALSLLALGVAGVAQLRHSAYRHISLTKEIQQASYFADSHLNSLSSDTSLEFENAVKAGLQTGEYFIGQDASPYPWALTFVPLSADALKPESRSLSNKVRPIRVDLSVWLDQGKRELRFHSLLLLAPKEKPTQPRVELGLNK